MKKISHFKIALALSFYITTLIILTKGFVGVRVKSNLGKVQFSFLCYSSSLFLEVVHRIRILYLGTSVSVKDLCT